MRLNTLFRPFLLGVFFCSSLHASYNVGILDFDPPYVYSVSQGFDIDLIGTICKKLETTCNLVPMNYNNFFTALDNGTIDFALGAIFIKKDSNYLFSLPYMVGSGQFMILKSSTVTKVDDLKGAVIGVLKGNPSGSVFVDFLNQHYPGLFQIKEFAGINDLVNALSNKSIAAAYMRHSSVKYWTRNDSEVFKSFGPVDTVGSGMGVMTTPQNTALIEQINTIFKQMEADGRYVALYNTYFSE